MFGVIIIIIIRITFLFHLFLLGFGILELMQQRRITAL